METGYAASCITVENRFIDIYLNRNVPPLCQTSVSSGNWHADDAGEHLVQGFRIAALIEEEHQFESLHIHAFECVRAWSWSVPYQHGAVAMVRNRGWSDGAGMQHDVTSFPLKRHHLFCSNSLHHESVLP